MKDGKFAREIEGSYLRPAGGGTQYFGDVMKGMVSPTKEVSRCICGSRIGTALKTKRNIPKRCFLLRMIARQEGQATSFMALFLGILMLGFLAFGLDVANLFRQKRMAQAAADAAALAAEEEYTSGSTGNEQAVANAMAKLNGFDTTLASGAATVTLSVPSSGSYAGSTQYVQAVVSQPVHTLFLSAFLRTPTLMTVSARAVAGGGQSSPTCICLEGQSGMDLNLSNNAQISAPSCGITVDSSSSNAVGVSGGSQINALSLGTVSTNWTSSGSTHGDDAFSVSLDDDGGGDDGGGDDGGEGGGVNNGGSISSTTKVVKGITSQCSPSIAAPTLPSGLPCYDNPIVGYTQATNYTGRYSLPTSSQTTINNVVCYNSLDTSQSASVNFSPGYTYYIKGNFTTGGGAPLSGNNVQFYVGGNVNIANGVQVSLAAPTVGSSPAVPQTLLYVAGSTVTIQGGCGSNLSGLIYAPNAAVTLNNGSGTTMNADFVAQSLTMAGGATLNSFATSSLGTLNLSVAKVVE